MSASCGSVYKAAEYLRKIDLGKKVFLVTWCSSTRGRTLVCDLNLGLCHYPKSDL
jgi:hypothetical protein